MDLLVDRGRSGPPGCMPEPLGSPNRSGLPCSFGSLSDELSKLGISSGLTRQSIPLAYCGSARLSEKLREKTGSSPPDHPILPLVSSVWSCARAFVTRAWNWR